MNSSAVRKVSVVMACFNRRETTLSCLERLYSQEGLEVSWSLEVFLLDDASSDDTAAAVRERFPDVHIIEGDGGLFWGGGMRVAMQTAAAHPFDFQLWLNDDVALTSDAITQLLSSYDTVCKEADSPLNIICGATTDPASGNISYSGFRRTDRWHPAKVVRVLPTGDNPTPCDTMNGNCVLVPKELVDRIGLIDGAFIHQIGDMDYGYRAAAAGAGIYVSPTPIGTCAPNPPPTNPLRDVSYVERLRRLNSPKIMPFGPWAIFMWRHGGPIGFIHLIAKYIQLVFFGQKSSS